MDRCWLHCIPVAHITVGVRTDYNVDFWFRDSFLCEQFNECHFQSPKKRKYKIYPYLSKQSYFEIKILSRLIFLKSFKYLIIRTQFISNTIIWV